MAQLIAQTLGVILAGLILHRLAVRAGVRVEFPLAVAGAVLAVLGVMSVVYLREDWHTLDTQRAAAKGITAQDGRRSCTSSGLDPGFLGWLEGRLPRDAKYVLRMDPGLEKAYGALCLRMLLVPRLQVTSLDDAGYVVFWNDARSPLLAEVRRRGGTVTTYTPGFLLARMP